MTAERIPSYTAVLARIALGVVFIYLGVAKAVDPVAFLKLVRQFGVLESPPALNVIAAVLPWFEVFSGMLLLLGVKPRATASVQFVMLAGFTVLVLARAIAIYRSGGVPFCAVKFDCGCGTGEVLICMKLAENAGLLVLAGLVAAVPTKALCLSVDK